MTAREMAERTQLGGITRSGIPFTVLGLALGGILIATTQSLYGLEGRFATLAGMLPLGYAFVAGMVATVNPCGILLLPSLVAYYLTQGEVAPVSVGRRAGKAVLLGAMATLGFVVLFAIVGLIVGAGGYAVARLFPIGGLLVGLVLVGVGGWLALSGQGLGLLMASRAMDRVRLGDDLRSLFTFGVAYAICSLACTLPIFLVVAGAALAAGSPLGAARQFVSYALGMGSVLTAVILGAAFFQGAVSRWVRGIVPYVHRLAAAFLLGAGIFVTNYWWAAAGWLR